MIKNDDSGIFVLDYGAERYVVVKFCDPSVGMPAIQNSGGVTCFEAPCIDPNATSKYHINNTGKNIVKLTTQETKRLYDFALKLVNDRAAQEEITQLKKRRAELEKDLQT